MSKTLLAVALTLVLGACGGSDETPASAASDTASRSGRATGELNLFMWSDYADPATVEAFGKDNKINVSQAFYDSNEALEAKVLTGKSGFDLVIPSLSNAGRQIQAGAYQEIDKSQIPNYNNIDPELLKLMAQIDTDNKYAVPYFWGINTLAINTQMVAKALGTDKLPENEWDLVFNPEYTKKLKHCGISFFDSPTEQFPLALKYIGKDPNSTDKADLAAAAAAMKKVRADVRQFSSSAYINNLAQGELCVAIGYGGDLNIAKRRAAEAGNANIRVLVPKTGVGIWVDSFMIPKDAKNIANAHKYINYTLNPKTAAQNADFVTYAPASLPARELMDKTLANDPSVFPDEATKANSYVVRPNTKGSLKNRPLPDIRKNTPPPAAHT